MAVRPNAKLPTAGLHCKSWEEFAKPGAPHLDFVFTVCDGAPGEVCPVWPGHPITGHWNVPDPTSVKGSQEEIDRAFLDAFTILERRISLFLSLPLASLDEVDQIGSSYRRSAPSVCTTEAR